MARLLSLLLQWINLRELFICSPDQSMSFRDRVERGFA
jgi:hypothetical protein